MEVVKMFKSFVERRAYCKPCLFPPISYIIRRYFLLLNYCALGILFCSAPRDAPDLCLQIWVWRVSWISTWALTYQRRFRVRGRWSGTRFIHPQSLLPGSLFNSTCFLFSTSSVTLTGSPLSVVYPADPNQSSLTGNWAPFPVCLSNCNQFVCVHSRRPLVHGVVTTHAYVTEA